MGEVLSVSTLPSCISRPEGKAEAPEAIFFSRRVVGGVPWTVASKLVLFLAYFGISVVTVRTLGADRYGLFSLCRNIGEYLIVVCGLGFNTALVRFIPELLIAQNRTGLRNLLWKTGALQAGMVAVTGLALWAARPWFDGWFHVDFQYYLPLVALLAGVELSRNFINDAFTSLFQVRIVSIMSICRGVLWFGMAAALLPAVPEVHVALLAQIAPFAVVSVVGGILLAGFVRRLDWHPTSSPGIGQRRTMKISLASALDSVANMLVRRYSEVFFLGVFATPAIVGMYDLGCSLPFMIVTFIPLAVQNLFVSGFAEAYAKDKGCLGRLIASFYRALILTVIPISVFGAFWAPQIIPLLYGPKMQAAGPIAALFFILHTVPLIYMPLSMAIITKEKILNMFPLTVLQIAVGLSLDYLLIPRFGVYGAVGAVLGAHAIAAPCILYAVSRIVGGVYFPFRFFVKITGPLVLLGALLSPLSPQLNVATLLGLGVGYAGAYLVMIRKLRLVRPEDVGEFRDLGFDRLNRILDYLVGSPSERAKIRS